MPKYMFLTSLCLLGFSHALHAQTLPAQVSVYFETGNDALTDSEKARLDSLVKLVHKGKDLELGIAAYTDDQGDSKSNRQLAHARAYSVREYLDKYKLSIREHSVEAVGEVQLNASNEDANEQRRKNRRVTITIDGVRPRTPQELFNHLSRTYQQFYGCSNPQKEFVIKGEKGTSLFIPANAFVLKNGQNEAPQAPLRVELREAYSIGDMLAQNLSTTSGNQLLQTGGMIYLAAKDALGRELALQKDKSVKVTMPSPKPLPEGMQVFTAPRAGADNGNSINWTATNQPFRSRTSAPSITGSNLGWIHRRLHPWAENDLYTKADFKQPALPFSPLVAPTAKPKSPAPPRAPLRPYIDKIRANNSQKLLENKTTYQERTQKLYEEAMRTYEAQTAEYEQMLQTKHPDWYAYNTSTKKYETELKNLEDFLEQQFLKTFPLIYQAGNSPLGIAYRLADICEQQQLGTLKAKADTAVVKASKLQRTPTMQAFFECENRAEEAFTSQNTLLFRLLAALYIESDPSAGTGFYKYDRKKLKEFSASFYNLRENATADPLVNFSAELHQILSKPQIWAQMQAIQTAYTALFKTDLSEVNKLLVELEKVRSLASSHPAIQIATQRQDKEDQLQEAMNNTAMFSELGWVNCDKFTDYPDVMHFSIQLKNTDPTRYFLILPDEQIVLSLESDPKSVFTPKTYRGVPASKKAKLIGVRVSNKGTEVCEHKGLVSDMPKAVLTFKPVGIQELQKIMAKI